MDEIKKSESNHLTVLFRGNFYKINVINEDDSVRSPGEILGELQAEFKIELDDDKCNLYY